MILPSWFQLLIDGSTSTVVLDGLRPQTEYNVKVFAVVGELSSEPVSGAETTCKFSSCSSSSSSLLPLQPTVIRVMQTRSLITGTHRILSPAFDFI